MPTLVYDNGVLVVKLRHTTRKADGTLQYLRRVPKDLQEHYGKVFMPRRSLSGLSPTEAAKQVAAWVKQEEAEWASIRAHPSTPEHLRAKVDSRLDKWRKLPRERYPDEEAPTEAEHLGEVLDDYLQDAYGDSYYELKVDPRFKGRDINGALRHRLSALDFATYQQVMALREPNAARPMLSKVLEEYLRSKGPAFDRKSGPATRLALKQVIQSVGDRPLGDYNREHARQVRDAMLASGVKTTSVRRRLNSIKAVYNFGRIEFDLGTLTNPFEKLKIANEGDDAVKRHSFTPDEIRLIAAACQARNDDAAWIIALMVETGARPGEIVGLRHSDVFLEHEVPHIWIRSHTALGKTIKTKASDRKVPLLGVSLWAARAAPRGSDWLFPRYARDHKVTFDSASARLNPWLKEVSGSEKTCYSFRHTMIDRLRAEGVAQDVRQAITGHGVKSVHDQYGEGFRLKNLLSHLEKVVITSV